jgi:hypothetical protein
MFIPDPGFKFFHPKSRIQGQKDSSPRIRINIKEYKYATGLMNKTQVFRRLQHLEKKPPHLNQA